MSNLLIKETSLGFEKVFPKNYILNLKDKDSGKLLSEILRSFNMLFLTYTGNKSDTRKQVPMSLRHAGLWITYIIGKTVITEWYNNTATDDITWGSDTYWREGSNMLVGDISISKQGTWVINGEDTGISPKGDKGDSPIIRIFNNRILVSYDKGISYRDLNNTPIYTQFRFNADTNTHLVSYDLGNTWQDVLPDKVYYKFKYNESTNTYQVSTDFGKTWSNVSAEKVIYKFRFNSDTNTHLVSTDLGKNWVDISNEKVFYKFRTNENKLQVSTDLGSSWEDCSELIAAWFRWTNGDTANSVGKLQISRDELKTWTDLSPNITNNLYIKGYVATVGNLPTSTAALGDIYMVGPTYDESDTTHDYPHYRMWVKLSDGWVDNGEFKNVLVTEASAVRYDNTALHTQETTVLECIEHFYNIEQIDLSQFLPTLVDINVKDYNQPAINFVDKVIKDNIENPSNIEGFRLIISNNSKGVLEVKWNKGHNALTFSFIFADDNYKIINLFYSPSLKAGIMKFPIPKEVKFIIVNSKQKTNIDYIHIYRNVEEFKLIFPTVYNGVHINLEGSIKPDIKLLNYFNVGEFILNSNHDYYMLLYSSFKDLTVINYLGENALRYAALNKAGDLLDSGYLEKGIYNVYKKVPKGTDIIRMEMQYGASQIMVFDAFLYPYIDLYQDIYVSSSSTEEWENGSMLYPFHTIPSSINRTRIYLKCGDIFNISKEITLTNSIMLSYGYGKKPIISGFTVIDLLQIPFILDSTYGDNIWKLDLTTEEALTIVNPVKNIGLIYHEATDKIIFGRKVNFFTEEEKNSYTYSKDLAERDAYLLKDGDFIERDYGIIYVYSTTDPNLYKEIKVSRFISGVTLSKNGKISDIRIEGFSYNGVQIGIDSLFSEVDNCDIVLIGGGSLNNTRTSYMRSGNAIEAYLSLNSSNNRDKIILNIKVTNCFISRVYDCGFTTQGRIYLPYGTDEDLSDKPKKTYCKNILVSNNVFYKCRLAFEFFASTYLNGTLVYNIPSSKLVKLENYEFSNNLCIGTNSEFMSPNKDDFHLLYGTLDNQTVKDNVFIDSNFLYEIKGSRWWRLDKGNICYIREGQALVNKIYYPKEMDSTTWLSGASSYLEAVNLAISKYREQTDDYYTTFIRLDDTMYNTLLSLLHVNK